MHGRTAIVTGAASGFGAEMARLFVASGMKVLLADTERDGVERLASELDRQSGQAVACHCDVTRPEDVDSMVQAALDAFGQVNLLVNNAGLLGPAGSLEDTTAADYDAIFAVNVRGTFLGCRAVLPTFRAQKGGVILNIASGSALRPRAGAVVYSASKGAVITLTRALAAEVAPFGIRVNAICPAISRTPLAERFIGEADAEVWDRLGRDIPLGRLISPDDIAQAALFLASDAASMITGTCLPVDGGRCI